GHGGRGRRPAQLSSRPRPVARLRPRSDRVAPILMGAAYVVRHAKAGDRGEWTGDDRMRPLTKSGQRQAEGLANLLDRQPIDKILSSGYLRCVQTVEPLGARRQLPVEPVKELEEGAGGESVGRLVQKVRGRHLGRRA